MEKYRVDIHIPGAYDTVYIECRELVIHENCYTFWKGEYGKHNILVASYPIHYTVVKSISDEN